jgi:hypothetical protein
METKTTLSTAIGLKNQTDYGKLTLLQLADRIVNNNDTQALKELHDNRWLNFRDCRRKYHLAEYIEMRKNSEIAREWCSNDTMVLEEAYNLCIDKFNNIPSQTNDRQQAQQGADCRRCLSAYIVYTKNLLNETPPANALEAEMISCAALRRMIDRQFYFSCLEAKRKAYRFVRRYRLELNQGDLYLLLPWEITKQGCKKWLQANINIDDIDPRRSGEKQRVQAIIDRLLSKRRLYFLSELYHIEEKLPHRPDPLASMIEEQITIDGLAETVADEKAENIKRQRIAIQLLGKDKLKELIRTVFRELTDGKYVEKDIACRFELSRATMSRFAGSHWKQTRNNMAITYVPDLWRNTAHTLAGHLEFVIAAKKAGVFKCVRKILNTDRTQKD